MNHCIRIPEIDITEMSSYPHIDKSKLRRLESMEESGLSSLHGQFYKTNVKSESSLSTWVGKFVLKSRVSTWYKHAPKQLQEKYWFSW